MTPITSNMGRASGRGPSLGMYRSDGDLIFILIDIIYYILSLSSLFKVKVKKMYSSSSSVYWHSNLVTLSDWLRMLAHIDTGNRKFDARGNRTHNLAVWSRTRITDDTYHLQHGPSLGMYRSDGRV